MNTAKPSKAKKKPVGKMNTRSMTARSKAARKKEYLFEPFKVTEVKCRGSEIPRPRSGHRIACDDVNIYCFGGYNPLTTEPVNRTDNPTWSRMRPLFKELWSFSIATQKWKQHRVLENMPEELASNAMCMNGRYLMASYYFCSLLKILIIIICLY